MDPARCTPGVSARRWFLARMTASSPFVERSIERRANHQLSGSRRVRGKDKRIAIYTDSFPYHSFVNPDQGAEFCISSIYDKLVNVGAKPIALTNCLNFGNPENPEIMFEFKETIDGMAKICEKLDFPIVSGNVSFYNETSGQNILPTPVFGAIGLMEH